MAKQRIKGGKKIETVDVYVNGSYVKLDMYLVRGELGPGVEFVAVCDSLNVEMRGADLYALTKEASKLVVERSAINWKRFIYVTVSGGGLNLSGLEERVNASCSLSIRASLIELGTYSGKNVRRAVKSQRFHGETAVFDGWPQVDSSSSLVPDTEENRAALASISSALMGLQSRLQTLLNADNAESTLRQLTTGSVNVLSAGEPDNE